MRPERSHTRNFARLSAEVEEFLRSVNLVVGLEQLLEILSAKLRELSGAETVFLALYEPVTNRFTGRKAKGRMPEALSSLRFSPSDRLVKWLTVNQRPLDLTREHEIVRYLSLRERDLLLNAGIALLFPFIAVNRLTGAALLTRKADGGSYEQSEVETLMLLANHSALAIEHALLYQFQEDKLKRILHADKLATVGELAAGAAHEIRNPLTSIRSTAQFLTKDLPEERRPLVNGIIEEVDRIDHIIASLLSLSKSTELKIVRVDLADILRQTLLLLEPELHTRRITVEEEMKPESAIIEGDQAQLKQLFLNILLNSIQAMPQGGNIAVRIIENTALGGEDRQGVVVTVRDTGRGIPAEDLPKVFDPFFTTKENGTGLGLSISYGIVSKHGGEIQIGSSTDGTGTTVTMYLPRRVSERGS
jgi:signal transduction histidine kinase